jgi:hypothetical protein
MPKRPKYSRIAITIPASDLAAADAIARERQRSRSWVIAEAVRRYAAEPVPAPPAFTPGLGPLRLAQLAADLRLTPEQRVRAAEQTARASRPRNAVRAQRVIGFDNLNDYLAWKRLEDLGA